MPPAEVFLSHSTVDRTFAEALAHMLRRHGVPVWYSGTNLVGAQQWQDEIGDALDRCDWFLAVLSPASVESMWVRREVTYALQEPRLVGRIVPVLFQDCELRRLSWVLPTIQYVDLRGEAEEGYRQLLRVWGLNFRPES